MHAGPDRVDDGPDVGGGCKGHDPAPAGCAQCHYDTTGRRPEREADQRKVAGDLFLDEFADVLGRRRFTDLADTDLQQRLAQRLAGQWVRIDQQHRRRTPRR